MRIQVGLPDHAEALEAQLEYQLHASHGDVRGFLASAAERRDLGEFTDVIGMPLLRTSSILGRS